MFLISSCSCFYPIHRSQLLSWEWRCNWSSADRRCSNYISVMNNFIAYKGVPYIRDLIGVVSIKTIHEKLWIKSIFNKVNFFVTLNLSNWMAPGLGRVHKSWVRVRVWVLCLAWVRVRVRVRVLKKCEYEYFSLSLRTSTSYPKY